MAEINLLQSSNNQHSERTVQKILNTVGVVLLVLVILGYGALFALAKQATNAAQSTLSQEETIKKSIVTKEEYPALLENQVKVKSVQSLIDSHLNWCMILPNLAETTLKATTLTKLSANSDGTATVSGTVNDFQTLAKAIQAFEQDQKQFIKDVKLVNVGKSSNSDTISIAYTLIITFNNKVLSEYVNKCNS